MRPFAILIAGFITILYMQIVPEGPWSDVLLQYPPFSLLEGDLPGYALRMMATTLLFGVLPLFCVSSDCRTQRLGLNRPQKNPFNDPLFLLTLLVFPGLSTLSGFDSTMASFYPYSVTLTGSGLGGIVLHLLIYTVFYYLPWELFFRGFLILPLLPDGADTSPSSDFRWMFFASVQIIPSALAHPGHPIQELFAALPFGMVCGYCVLRYRSIWPGFLLHVLTGLALDITVLLHWGGSA
ncbi:MAG: CPBP family intramembrane metalloprotease [Spirochaetales bacterium]|nr:CPBP family intramembrane metalloprotease [Spirochaetales bacterium]